MQKDDFNKELINAISMLKVYALKLTGGNKCSADDLIQESLLHALSTMKSCYCSAGFNGWMHTIIHHTYINECKKDNLRKSIIEPLTESSENDCIYNENADDNIYVEEIMDKINSFSEEYRNIFRLYISGHKYREISERLSIPLGTVKSRIFSVRKALQEMLTLD